MSRVHELNYHLKRYDSELYAVQDTNPHVAGAERPTSCIYVYRRNRARPHEPHYVFALTDNWTPKGQPVDWGIEPILNRLKAIDIWRDGGAFIEQIYDDYGRQEESDRRQLKNSVESFLYDFRRQFAKATDGINTSLLSKTDARRKGDLKYGSRK